MVAKLNKRLTVKGIINYQDKEVIEFDKDLGEIRHSFDDIFAEFINLEDVVLTLSHDKIIDVD